MSENEYEFSAAIQKKILAMLLFDAAALSTNIDVVRPEFFDNPALRDIAAIIYQFYQKYKRAINIEELGEEFETLLAGNQRLPEQEYRSAFASVLDAGTEGDFEYVRDKALSFAKVQAVRNALLDANEIYKKRKDFDPILTKIREALAVGERNLDVGTFYFQNLDARIAKRASGETRQDRAITTGVGKLDHMLGGGLGRGELGVIMGPMKRGKTLFSVNMAYGAMNRGIKVVHYIMEGSEDRLQVLYDARISGISKDDVVKPAHFDEVKKAVEDFYGRPGIERLVVKHFPAQSCTPLAIEAHINKLALYKFDPELIIVDYLGLMTSTHKAIAKEGDRYLMFGQITKELLSLAQRGGYAIWLLHQSTRGSKNKRTVDLEDSADSIEPMRDADLILTLNQDEVESPDPNVPPPQSNRIKIFLAGGREMADRNWVVLKIDKSLCRIEEIPGDET